MENGKNILGYENYIIYPNGLIFSLKSNKYLKPILHQNGYVGVTLYNNGQGKQFLLHRLVAQHFLSNPKNLPEVDHIDCNRQNNDVSNLQWISSEDNIKKSYDLKRQTKNKTPIRQLDLTGKIIAEFDSIADAFRATGIRHIVEVAKHQRKTAGGYKWEYI